jgi:uncharacterized protein (DUF952 family)
MEKEKPIYHIVTVEDLKANTSAGMYTPVGFENDGFIHCTGEQETCLLVLGDYFSNLAADHTILILEIDTARVQAEVKFEAPAPIEGGGTAHIKEGVLFPHIYGSLNIDAVCRAGITEMKDGKFVWPETFEDIRL